MDSAPRRPVRPEGRPPRPTEGNTRDQYRASVDIGQGAGRALAGRLADDG